MGSCIFRSLQVQTTCKQCAMQIAKLIEAGGMETPPTYSRPVGWGGSRGSNEPPKIFEVGIFGELKR